MADFTKKLCFLFGVLLFIQFQFGNSIKLNSDGGYEIVVALDESTSIPTVGAASYIANIRTSLRSFSSRLWVATKNHFYLKSVDILVPSHWNVDSALSATTQNFANADIRLSPNTTYPYADNPNVCGQPGNFIQLPSSFFNVTHSGPYGLHWKSLLHAWALYRFGVHPEHGYIDDSKFPYATRNLQTNQWTVTGCSNRPIHGKFTDLTNPDDTTCGTGSVLPSNCRFVPTTTGQNATTSLMHFHWIESVTEFCDESNHDLHAQNKQNALCDHKSVWEVIRESTDYLDVTSPRNTSVPAVTIRTFKHSSTPLLYILIDRGLVQGSFSIANNIPRLLSNYLTDNALIHTVASIGAFPGNDNTPVIDLVPWSELGANRNAFIDAVGHLRADGPLVRDFSTALVAVAEKIKAKNHPNGAVAVLIKYGADTKNFGGYLPESEVFNAFNEGNIILNSIELNFPNHTGYSHLARVAQQTAGTYVTLNSLGEAETNIRNVLNYVKRTLETEYTDLKKNWKILRREKLTTATSMPVSTDIRGSLQIFASTSNPSLSAANFSISGSQHRNGILLRDLNFRFSRSQDWNEAGSKFTYKLEIPGSQLEGISQISMSICRSMSPDCVSSILARAQVFNEPQVNIELSTSLKDGHIDLSVGRPVSIFAKITKNGKPVQNAEVIATLTSTLNVRNEIRLRDDGKMAPDAQEMDGIYSEYFAPENDGQFRLSVTVYGNPSRTTSQRKLSEGAFSRLIPIDQGDMGCGAASCGSEIIEGQLVQIEELNSPFSVMQASLYSPSPTKVISLMTVDAGAPGQITLYWEPPRIPGRSLASASSYELKSASSFELLLNNFDNQTEVPLPPNFRPQPSGLELIYIAKPASTTYYAIRSVYRGKKSSISNIASLVVQNPTTTPPPTPPTSTTPSQGTQSPPTSGPTMPPSSDPTLPPTEGPTLPPSSGPTLPPTEGPTLPPSSGRTLSPTSGPTMPPTSGPTMPPTSGPTLPPSSGPTLPPSSGPTIPPTSGPTMPPSSGPTLPPSSGPTMPPSSGPTLPPSSGPTLPPSSSGPTLPPTSGPTMPPSSGPTLPPSSGPTLPPSSGDPSSSTDDSSTSSETTPTSAASNEKAVISMMLSSLLAVIYVSIFLG